jgi:hypothetical protein
MIHPHFVYVGSRLGQIFHARIHMGCSALNSDLFRKNIWGWGIVIYGVNRLLLKMNFCTDKKISVFWLIVNSLDPTNRSSEDKGIGRLRANTCMWYCLGML